MGDCHCFQRQQCIFTFAQLWLLGTSVSPAHLSVCLLWITFLPHQYFKYGLHHSVLTSPLLHRLDALTLFFSLRLLCETCGNDGGDDQLKTVIMCVCMCVWWWERGETEAADGWWKYLSYHQLWLASSGSECWVHPNHFPGSSGSVGCVFCVCAWCYAWCVSLLLYVCLRISVCGYISVCPY